MERSTQLQFKLVAPEAQVAAIQRLALCGASVEEIAAHIGWIAADVRRALAASEFQRNGVPRSDHVATWVQKTPRVSLPGARSLRPGNKPQAPV
jgi:hypothetical protein